jgi:hypothetical protein
VAFQLQTGDGHAGILGGDWIIGRRQRISMGKAFRSVNGVFATVVDFIHYDGNYHRLQFYAESRIISLNDVARMLFRDDETPPGMVEYGASITAGAGISRWRPVCGDFPTSGTRISSGRSGTAGWRSAGSAARPGPPGDLRGPSR